MQHNGKEDSVSLRKIGYLCALEIRGNSWEKSERKRAGSWMSNLKVGESKAEEGDTVSGKNWVSLGS